MGYFDFISGSLLSGERSDKGEVIEWAFHLLKSKTGGEFKREDVVMVGDREHDVIGAEKIVFLLLAYYLDMAAGMNWSRPARMQ